MRVDHIPGLARDIAGMEGFYPQFRLVIPLYGAVHWRGPLRPYRTRLDTFEVVVAYGPIAGTIPQVWIVGPEISQRTHPLHPHLNRDGSACTFFVPDRTYDPDRDDIGRLVDLAGDWLRRNLFFELAGWWPGAEAPHEAPDVLAELARRPDVRCVCGSLRPFRLCCRDGYRRAAGGTRPGSHRLHPAFVADRRRLRRVVRDVRGALGPLGFATVAPHLGPGARLLASATSPAALRGHACPPPATEEEPRKAA
ncbi:MAG TPA: hypothetical protein VGB92_07365 [Longimicrobium sp.]|jgi:hypothetical protein